MEKTKRRKTVLAEVYERLKKVKVSLRVVDRDECDVVGLLEPFEIACRMYQGDLLAEEADLLRLISSLNLSEQELRKSPIMEECEFLRKREDLAYDLLWDSILSRFPDDDETTLDITSDFRIIRVGILGKGAKIQPTHYPKQEYYI